MENNQKNSKTINIQQLSQDISKEISDDIVKTKPNEISSEMISDIVINIATKFKIPESTALKAIFILLLRGAANIPTPGNLKARILNTKGEEIIIRKDDLMYEYRFATGNNFLRRLADTMASEISQFAEKNELDGEIAQKINNLVLREGDAPLSLIERAWCSSFNQNNPDLSNNENTKRVAILLAKDLYERKNDPKGFKAKKIKSSPKPSPRSKGPGKRNKGGQKKSKNK
jgi:hypothetical protein